jgi:ketol-acid reductoisomerase
MRARISETAKWGDITVGPKIVDATVKARMKEVLADIQRGRFAKDWLRETATGRKRYQRLLDVAARQPIEEVGERLRNQMPWLDEKS